MDFRNVTRLFADPDWDGPIEIDPNYPPKQEEPKPLYSLTTTSLMAWKNPIQSHDRSRLLPPAELLADYFKKRKALDHEIDKTLAEIQRILGINVNVDEL